MNFYLPSIFVALYFAAVNAKLEDEYHDPLNTGSREWRLAFRGTAYIRKSVIAAYNNGSSIPQFVEDACRTFASGVPCRNHYRNYYVLDKWDNIDEVLFAVYDRGQVVKHIIFDGVGTDYKNWFDAERIKSSSWVDIHLLTHNFFSIEGDDLRERRFFISHIYNHCPEDLGWFLASETVKRCGYEGGEDWPTFLYSPDDGNTDWNAHGSRADAFGIFVRYDNSMIRVH